MYPRLRNCLRDAARRLCRDERGNTMLFIAAGMIPVTAAVGGGVDMTMAYMAEARLQQAVDSASLAGRKILTGTDVSNGSAAGVEVMQFLTANFPPGIFGHTGFTRSQTIAENGNFCVTASATLPTILLGRFQPAGAVRRDSIAISSTSCSRRSGSNIDVVLVLDVTGSMSSWTSSGGTRIEGLRTATKNFLATMDDTRSQLAANGLRVRIGIVPYSQTVNIGRLLVADVPYANGIPYVSTGAMTGCDTAMPSTPANCNWTDISWPPYKKDGDWINPTTTGGTQGSCVRRNSRPLWPVTGTGCPTTAPDMHAAPDLTNFTTDAGVPGDAWTNAYKWKGCVEARQSITTIGSSTSKASIPSGAWDIIDAAPGASVNGTTAPAWRPYFALPRTDTNEYGPPGSTGTRPTTAPWNQIAWEVTGSSTNWVPSKSAAPTPSASSTGGEKGPNINCPAEAKRLSEAASSTYTSYVDGLKPVGATLHDIGMYWGIAMISPAAPFVNETSYMAPGYNDEPREVKRYIIFMTDGEMNPSESNYSAWGIESWQKRVASSTPTDTQHNKRFAMLCEYAKQQGVTISTVSFGLTEATSAERASIAALKDCSSSADQYFSATNSTALINIFKQIANNIGYLRIAE